MTKTLVAVFAFAGATLAVACSQQESPVAAAAAPIPAVPADRALEPKVQAAPVASTLPAPADRIDIAVTEAGFVPAQARVKVGAPVTLAVTRKTERTCATEIVIKEYGIKKSLPLNTTVEVVLTPKKPGKIRYACGMDMISGDLIAE